MKKQLNKILKITFLVLFFTLSKSHAIDDVSEFTDAINDAREKFDAISEGSSEQSKIIDEAIKEIDKATEYVQEAINNDNTEDAIKTLEFIEQSLSDVSTIIPQEFSSDMSNIDITVMSQEDMAVINEVTKQMSVAKEKKQNEFMLSLLDLNQKGIDTASISKNLNNLGVDTVKLVFDVDETQDIENWTKEEWAESYSGSILTSAGSDVITDKEIESKVVDLELKIDANNAAIIDKRTSLLELQTKIDPLTNQISDLEKEKNNILAKYNEELQKRSISVLSDEELNKSKELADQFNNQLTDIKNQITIAENQSNAFKQQVQELNVDLTNEISIKSQIKNNIKNLNNELSKNQALLSNKNLELTRLQNSDFKSKLTELNNKLDEVSLQRDFIQTQIERSLDKEVEHFQIYGNVFKDADMSETEIDFAFREVDTLLDGDPRRSRAFEIEKYGTFAGLSQSEIQSGINAALNDDWDTQKKVVKNIYDNLSQNPNWVVNKPSSAQLNVLIAEEQAIQEAVFTLEESRKVKEQVNKIISERTEQYQDFATIDTNKVSMAFTRVDVNGNLVSVIEGTKEGKLVTEKLNEILKDNQDFNEVQKSLNEKKELYSKILEENREYIEMIDQYNSEISKINNQVWEAQAEIGKVNLEKNKYLASINDADPTVWGGYALLNRAQGSPDHAKWTKTVKEFDQKIGELDRITTVKSTEALNKYSEQMIAMQEFETSGDQWAVRNEINNLQFESVKIQSEAAEVAKKNVINLKNEAVNEINKIRTEEIAKTGGLYNTEEAIFEILDKVPTFDEAQRERAEEVISGGYYRVGLGQIVSYDNKAAGLIAALDSDKNTYKAFKAAAENVEKIGKTPVLDSHHYEMTNVKLAAIVHSKLNGNYSYTHYGESDKLQLSTAQRAELKQELAKAYGSNNPTLVVLNTQVDALKSEINNNNTELSSLNENISKLESELSTLKNSETNIQNQLNDLTNQFNSKENIIAEKARNLETLQEKLNPISERMNDLQGQRAELDGKLNDQLNTIANQIESQGQVTEEAKSLKAEFESQIAQLDNQIKEFENQSNEINSQFTTLTSELIVLETETPELAIQIESLNQDLKDFKDVKAELAMATAKKLGLDVDEKAIDSVQISEGKVIIAIKGTEVVRVVDESMLTDQASAFIDPALELSKNRKLYSPKALNPELITPEFVQASRSLSIETKMDVLSESTALQTAGASSEESAKYSTAKATTIAARKDWDEAMKSGDKVAQAAAEKAFMAAREAETVAGRAAAKAAAQASVAAQAASSVTTEVAEAAQEAAQQAAQSVSTEVAAVAQDASKAAQEAALDALWSVEAAANNTFDVFRATAAIRQLQAEMNGNDFSYKGASSYEDAMKAIDEMEKKFNAGDKSAIVHGQDPNKIGKCGKASC